MTDRSNAADWAARRRAWETRRTAPSGVPPTERKPRFATLGDTTVDPLYGPWSLDDAGIDPARDIGVPGEPPFTRGIHPNGYRSRLWTMRMFAGFGAAEDTNARFRQLLDAGQTGLSIAYDMPTLYGYDTDDPEAEGEFGTCGVAVSSLADMEVLLGGLPLDRVSTSMTINSPAAPIWAMYIVAAEKAGVAARPPRGHHPERHPQGVRGPEGVPVPAGAVDAPGDRHDRVRDRARCRAGTRSRSAATTSARPARRRSRSWRSRSPTGWPTSRRRSSAACASTTSRRACRSSSTRHSDFFEEIAKFRASRRIWHRLMTERYGAENERSAWMRFHTQTAGVSLTPQQPLNNLTRVAVQALAAVLGGTQSLHTDAHDEALAVPTAEAALLALRQQQIIAEETGVDATVDPLGGSWFVEALTDETEAAVWHYIDEIDRRGGMVAAITEGYPQREIADAAYRFQQEFDAGERRIVGVNAYVDETEVTSVPVLSVPPGSFEAQMARLERTRRERDAATVGAALDGLREAARRPGSSETNLMPHFIRCAAAYATLGEQCAVLREVFGEYREPVAV